MRATFQLRMSSSLSCEEVGELLRVGWWVGLSDLNVDPLLLRKSLVLILKDLARCHVSLMDSVKLSGWIKSGRVGGGFTW